MQASACHGEQLPPQACLTNCSSGTYVGLREAPHVATTTVAERHPSLRTIFDQPPASHIVTTRAQVVVPKGQSGQSTRVCVPMRAPCFRVWKAQARPRAPWGGGRVPACMHPQWPRVSQCNPLFRSIREEKKTLPGSPDVGGSSRPCIGSTQG